MEESYNGSLVNEIPSGPSLYVLMAVHHPYVGLVYKGILSSLVLFNYLWDDNYIVLFNYL